MIESKQANKNSQEVSSIQPHDLIWRSIKLFTCQDGFLVDKARKFETTKNNLIRAATILKCEEWNQTSEKPTIQLVKGELNFNQDADLIISEINLTRRLENDLRMIAYKFQTTTNSLIRSAVSIKLEEWNLMHDKSFRLELSRGVVE